MKILYGILIGLIVGSAATAIDDDLYWQQKAFNHGAAVYYCGDVKNCELRWMWLDDFLKIHK